MNREIGVDMSTLLYTKWTANENLKVLVTQSCPALCDPMDCGPPGRLSVEFSR